MSFDLHTVYFDFRNIQMWLLHKKSIISTLRGLCIQVTQKAVLETCRVFEVSKYFPLVVVVEVIIYTSDEVSYLNYRKEGVVAKVI